MNNFALCYPYAFTLHLLPQPVVETRHPPSHSSATSPPLKHFVRRSTDVDAVGFILRVVVFLGWVLYFNSKMLVIDWVNFTKSKSISTLLIAID
uniref:Uncharacterized protein n=1 Tax=Lactuca sativa TaxID=4236 RepID=A0A9R1WH17_LACSA|nr:hypothetical protein LSAT_V11C200092330 [Lactuca sativa]